MSSKPGRGPRTGGDGATAPPKPPQNEILSRLPPNELAMLLEHTSIDEIRDRDHRLHRVGAQVDQIRTTEEPLHPERLRPGGHGRLVEGERDPVILSTARYKGMCQIAGDCLTADANTFLAIIEKMPELRRRLRRYSQFANEVAAQSVACNSVHEVEQRLARWLLVTADAIDSKSFDITQEFLSQMLAVRRPGVTVAMGALGRRGLLDHRYGKVTLLDVEGLKKTSCECYRRITQKAAELLGD